MLTVVWFDLSPCRVGHNEIIGVNRVGCNAEGLGRDHWNEMLAYPRKPVAHWHPLLESKKSEKEVRMCAQFNYTSTIPAQYLHDTSMISTWSCPVCRCTMDKER